MFHPANSYAATVTEPTPVGELFCRPDATAEKPGSQPHAGSTCAVLKVLKFTLEILEEKTEKMTGRIWRFTANSEAA